MSIIQTKNQKIQQTNFESYLMALIQSLEKKIISLQDQVANLTTRVAQLENQSQQKINLPNEISQQPISNNSKPSKKITFLGVTQTSNQNQFSESQRPVTTQNNYMNGTQKQLSQNGFQQQRPNSSKLIREQQQSNRQEMQNNHQQKYPQSQIIMNSTYNNQQSTPKQKNLNYGITKSLKQEPSLLTQKSNDSLHDIFVNCIHCNLPIQSNIFQLSCQHSFHQECIISLMKKQILQEKAKSITCVCNKEMPAEFLSLHSTSILEFEQLFRKLKQNQIVKTDIQQSCMNCRGIIQEQQGNTQYCRICQLCQQKGPRMNMTQQPNSMVKLNKR